MNNTQSLIILASDPATVEWKKCKHGWYFNVSFIDSAVIGLHTGIIDQLTMSFLDCGWPVNSRQGVRFDVL